jgi:hypothetical protein
MEIREKFDDKEEEVIRLFLLNMHLLTPGERGIIIKILNNLYGYEPIQEEFVRKDSKT